MKLTENFSSEEFACKCGCGLDDIDTRLVSILQRLRNHFKRFVVVTSGLRCDRYNRKVGGRPKSNHRLGLAADIKVQGVSPYEVAKIADILMPGWGGIKIYPTFTHIDVRPNKWRE